MSGPADAELIVQRADGRPVGSCPGHPACRQDGRRIVLELARALPGKYHASLVRGGKVLETSQPIWISAQTP